MAQQPDGFVPDGFVPDGGPPPTFKSSNETDVSGKPVVRDGIDRLLDWLPAVGGMGGGFLGMAGGPPGAIMGAALGGAAGEAYKELIKRARAGIDASPQQAGVPDSPLAATGQIGKEAAIQGASQAAGEVLGPAMTWTGQRLMQSAAKPGWVSLVKSIKAGESVPPVVKTLLDEGVNVTPGGVTKLQNLIGSTNAEITAALAPSTAQIGNVKVASRLSDTARTFANQVNPQADLKAISDVGENFLASRAATSMTPTEAQALKVGTYARIGEKYGSASAAGIEAEKALARGLKEEIAAEVPVVSAMNAREGRLLEALDAVGRRAALAGNKDPIGFAWVAHNPTTFIAALIDKNPGIKSMIARGMYQSAGVAAKVSPQLIRAAVVALTTGGSDVSPAQESSGSSSGPGRQ